jgi:tagaturonate epimerase
MVERPEPREFALRVGRAAIAESARSTPSGGVIWAERSADGIRIVHWGDGDGGLRGQSSLCSGALLTEAPATAANAAALRALLPNLRPVPLGLTTSAGMGDRLGLATPGHVAALRAVGGVGRIAPIFAQQSVRENVRTGRTPRMVLDDATLGAFAAGFTHPVGADADHLKSEADVDAFAAEGYSLFTLDPGEHVRLDADALAGSDLERAYADFVPWDALASSPSDLRARLADLTLDLGDAALRFAPGELERAAVKYGAAIAHVARLARHLRARAGADRAEIEVSVDETDTATTPAEHAFFALELRRLGVDFVSLAPRFAGHFEKGIDYQDDLTELALDLARQARVAAALGPYKLSLHSGSDKFAVYPIAAAATQGRVHLKTAGTSYLEALRVVGMHDPALLHAVMALALERFDEDVRSYHISGRPERVTPAPALPGAAALAWLERPDARQVLHVTFGSALRRYGAEIRALLQTHPDAYAEAIRRHFERHLSPFLPGAGA